MSEKKQTQNRLLFLDSLRGLASMFVVVHHAFINYFDTTIDNVENLNAYNLSSTKLNVLKVLYQGHLAVNLFIILSGYSLMLTVLKNNYQLKGGIMLFFKRRVIRILPTYYIAILISLILIWTIIGDKTHTHWDVSIPVNLIDIITHIFLIHDYFKQTFTHINHVFWSISVEFRIYLLFPLLLWFWRKKGALNVICVSLFITLTGFLVLSYLKQYVYYDFYPEVSGVSPYIVLFVFGMLAADLTFSEDKNKEKIRAFFQKYSVLLIITSVIFIPITGRLSSIFFTSKKLGFIELNIFLTHMVDIGTGLLLSIILFSISVNHTNMKSRRLNILGWKPLVFIGTFSYSLYLVHPLVLQVISKYFILPSKSDRFTAAWQLSIIGLVTSLIISYLFFLLFERPFLNWRKKGKLIPLEQQTIINPAP